ncbi:MAG: TolC family outer membrane protein [Sulfurimonas sp.]|nr:TolC family outer membrane protein [Sulfurimonas sp.]MBU3938745.1 TolC family outer membrane protein [bacterium]MBU4025029.1 TolC family outer membrane protein [bacterium]MBU4058526.1 TolC family outer membrane protein [bacterium]
MFKRYLFALLAIGSLSFTSLSALTLKESVVEAMNTNPVVQERLKNYRATQQDLNIAESEYYPKLDFRASFGHTEAGAIKDSEDGSYNHLVQSDAYENYEASLILTQNLFDGFGTTNKVDYQESRILAAAYNYIEKTNDIAFKMTSAYINVLRSYELLQTARENVQINESIFSKVKDLYNAGLTTDSEVKKIESALALSRSNLTVQLNNTRDTEFSFRRVLGRMPDVSTMVKPDVDVPMPDSIERAALYSINHNPSLLVSRYNIKGAQALWKQNEKDYYPKIDLEVSQNYSDASDRNAFDQPDDRFRARIVLNYNIFRGGADSATSQKNISKINQEIEIQRDLKRQVIEGLDLSWNAYEMIGLQLKDLKEYKDFSAKTLELYKEEYDLGRRSLLDLLAAQNDFINSKSQIITAEYEHLFSKYRILDAMGLLPMAVSGNEQDYASRVNLYTNAGAHEILDSVPVKLDVDSDNIPDNEDLCDNSVLENNIMPYGCKKIQRDSDGDGVYDSKDKDALTPKNAKVSPDGVALDSDLDGVKDYEDLCPNTPIGYTVDKDGCTSSLTLTVNFQKNSTDIAAGLKNEIDEFSRFMKNNPGFKANIVGHSSRTAVSKAEYNLKLSKERADAFKAELIKRGISAERLTTQGKGFEKPIADNSTEEGRYLNRRLEIELLK